MTTEVSKGRQGVIVASDDFDYSDLPSTAFVGLIEMPADAIILDVNFYVSSAFDAAKTISVGISTDNDKYLATIDTSAAGNDSATANVLQGAIIGGSGETIGLTASAAMTQGAGRLVVQYIRKSKVDHTWH